MKTFNQSMYKMFRRIKGDEENRRASNHRAKSSDHFLVGLILQVGAGLSTELLDSCLCLRHKVFNTVDGDLT